MDNRCPASDPRVGRSERNQVVALAVQGELDVASVASFISAARKALAGLRRTALAISMSEVNFIDAAGIGALVTIRNEAGLADNDVAVIQPSPCVSRVLALTGLSATFCIPPGPMN
jgi:anti-sigma B factor antagonist